MKELLFGWITKGQYELSFLDSIIAITELFIIFPTILLLIIFIYGYIKDKFFGGKK